MATFDLSAFDDATVVLHLGTDAKSIDAYTFAEVLTAFSDTAQSIASALDPAIEIQISVEGVAAGSIRALLRQSASNAGGFLSKGTGPLFWSIVGGVITNVVTAQMYPTPKINVIVQDNSVVIEQGNDRIIVPRSAHESAMKVSSNPRVINGLDRTFKAVERDRKIKNLGLAQSMEDVKPVVVVDRKDFIKFNRRPVLAMRPEELLPQTQRRRRRERARLVIVKVWLKSGNRKWTFEWNGVPIQAPIRDKSFFDKIASREYLIGDGDALDVWLEYFQSYVEGLRAYENEANTYEVVEVIQIIKRDGPQVPFDYSRG